MVFALRLNRLGPSRRLPRGLSVVWHPAYDAESENPMVTLGGESTMLGQWRVVLRQAEEAARGGRFEEAYALASRPDVADHHQAVQFRGHLSLDLIARAGRRASSDDQAGAIEDLRLAERFGAPPDTLAMARSSLAEIAAKDIQADLEVGEPIRAIDRIDDLARDKISSLHLRKLREIADAWARATTEGLRGEFGRAQEQIERASRLAASAGTPTIQSAVATASHDLETRRATATPLVEALYASLSSGEWPKILAAAEALVAIVPEHLMAREARANAWKQIAAVGPSSGSKWARRVVATPVDVSSSHSVASAEETRAAADVARVSNPLEVDRSGVQGRFLLWADAVGGFLVCLNDRVVLGRAGPDGAADVPLMGDLSRKHATLIRDGESYLLDPHHDAFVNGRRVTEATPLRRGDVIRLGETVELEFQQPNPFSATARLTIVSRHRLPLAVDGVLLMGETCIMGPERRAHIPAATIQEPVVLYRQGNSLWCRAGAGFEVDGRPYEARAPLAMTSHVQGDGFSFSLEPLESSAT